MKRIWLVDGYYRMDFYEYKTPKMFHEKKSDRKEHLKLVRAKRAEENSILLYRLLFF